MILRFYLTCISLCAISLIKAQTADSSVRTRTAASDTRIAAGQADSLFRAGRYFEASIAWERILFEEKDPGLLLTAVLGKTRCLKQQGLFDEAALFLQAWPAFPFPGNGVTQVHYEQVLCTYLGGHFENVLSLVDRWTYEHGGQAPSPLLVVLKILSLNELLRWKEAADTYHSFVASQHLTTLPPDLYTQIPHLKSMSKAEALSTFIPGAGQFYAGRPGEALFSILVQGAGIYFGILSFEQHYYISAWLIGAALFGAFHMGGVRRAQVLVLQYNRKKTLAFNEKVRTQLLSLVPSP